MQYSLLRSLAGILQRNPLQQGGGGSLPETAEEQRMEVRHVAKAKNKPEKSRLDSLLKLIILVLLALFVFIFVKTKINIADMQKQIEALEAQVEEQKLINKDMELMLRDQEAYMERSARENLDYADPEEEVYVDISGAE